MTLFLMAVLGAVLGSFYNVVGTRIPNNQSIVSPRSSCSCGRELKSFELVPVLSYVFLLGKSKCCKTRLSVLYPLSELVTAALFLYGYVLFGPTALFLEFIVLASLFVIITVSDLLYQIIPDEITIAASVILVPFVLITDFSHYLYHLTGAGVAILIMSGIVLFSKGKGMGGGDIKLFILLGFVFGWEGFVSLFILSIFVGLVHAIFMKFVKKTNVIPFVPSIAIATLFTLMSNNGLYHWYISRFF
jgi:leader peptidase (prepilin peptidase)/N-methyltransferase